MKNIILCLMSFMLSLSFPLQAVDTHPLTEVLVQGQGVESIESDASLKVLQNEEESMQQAIIEGHKKPCNKCCGIFLTCFTGGWLVGMVSVLIWHIEQ